MARLRPSLEELDQLVEPLNASELVVANALAALDDDWTVYIQPRIGQDQPDFLAVHDLFGVCVFEVLDWQPGDHRRTDGKIEYRDAAGAWHRAPRQPRYHAARYRFAIYDQFFALPNDGPDPTEAVRSVLVLPHFTTAQAHELLDDDQAHESDRKVAIWGRDGLDGQLDKVLRGNGCAHPRAESIIRLKRHVVASERVVTTTSPTPLSANARNLEQNQSTARVRRVRGPAGSGKSFGIAARAAHLAAQGRTVLVLSFNVTLANYLSGLATARCREQGANPTLITCSNFHSFCTRVVQNAEQLGIEMHPPKGASWPAAIVAKAQQAFEAGYEHRFDAVLVDEGQDFAMSWWNLLHEHVVVRGGEMLLAVDPTQDLYNRRTWVSEERMLEAGFSGGWTDLQATYRLPADLVPLANDFANAHIEGDKLLTGVPTDRAEITGHTGGLVRRWRNVDVVSDMGREIGREVVRLLRANPNLSPRDVAFICEYHHDGVAAVAEIEAAGYPVHHIFSRNPDDARRRRRYRFWPDADAVKGSTVHSFKGWEIPALVMGIGVEQRSRRLAYVALTRVGSGREGGPSYVSVVNADKRINDLQSKFEVWAAPLPSARVG